MSLKNIDRVDNQMSILIEDDTHGSKVNLALHCVVLGWDWEKETINFSVLVF